MTEAQLLKNLCPPAGTVDVVLDTDAYNEIDDQFAIAYLLRAAEKLHPVRFYAAPFLNARSASSADGMKKSYDEILHVLQLANTAFPPSQVLYGSEQYLPDEKTPVISPAAQDLASLAMQYSPENPLYVVAIGAITNIASALLLNPAIAENIVVVWLGGHAHHAKDTSEFNMSQDIAAARTVMRSAAPFVQLPCDRVVSAFTVSKPELAYWLEGKNPLADYLAKSTIELVESRAAGMAWTKVIWDVTAVAWLCNDNARFMRSEIIPVRLPAYTRQYEPTPLQKPMAYVTVIHRDALMTDLFRRLTE